MSVEKVYMYFTPYYRSLAMSCDNFHCYVIGQ